MSDKRAIVYETKPVLSGFYQYARHPDSGEWWSRRFPTGLRDYNTIGKPTAWEKVDTVYATVLAKAIDPDNPPQHARELGLYRARVSVRLPKEPES
jgi:hypothetical protein